MDTTTYVDSYLLVVPKKNIGDYKKMAEEGKKMWMRHGALAYRECIGDDLNPDMQGMPYLPFPKLTKLKPDETLWFSYVEFKSKSHRDAVNKKVMAEMEKMQKDDPDFMKNMPWDMKRFSYGGFKVEVNG